MRTPRLLGVLLVSSAMLAAPSAVAPAQAVVNRVPVQGTAGQWSVEGPGRDTDVKAAPFLGRDALWLKNGTHAIVAGPPFSDGTIELDVAPMDQCDFVALVFRRESLATHENLYLRVRQSGKPMALQYAPRTNGSATWQLYPEFTVPVAWPRQQWTTLRVEVRGSRLEVFVGGQAVPVLSVPRLRLDVAAGAVAVWARVNDDPDAWAAAVSNVRVTPAPAARRDEPAAPPPGYLARWDLSEPMPTDAGRQRALPAVSGWSPVTAEDSGLVNLNRHVRAQRGRRVVLGRTTLTAASNRRVLAGIGYSDDVTVFVNGEPVFSGVNGWESRAPEYASFVDARFESVWLPLRAGDNEIVLAVSDDQRFGWGFAVRIEPADAAGLTMR